MTGDVNGELGGVVFDLDGVLLDSEPLHCRAIREVLSPLGVVFEDEEYATELMGLDDRTLIPRACAMRGKELDAATVERLAAAKTVALARILAPGVDAFPGALELLREAGDALPVALCSGSRRVEIDLILQGLGEDVPGRFVATVSADDVVRSKPDPAGYFKAVAALGLEPSACLAIEDTPTGTEAARAAGLFVVAVDNLGTPERLARANHVVSSLADVQLTDLYRWFARNAASDTF